jgi:hypothetical protein
MLSFTQHRRRARVLLIPFLLCLFFLSMASSTKLLLGSFNIQVLGKSKMSKSHVVTALVKILLRYDLVLVQEIRDKSETAIHDLLLQLNAASPANAQYRLFLSSRLGRTSSKEQLGWFYKAAKITKVGDEQIVDAQDIYERPPQVVYFDLSSGQGLGKPSDTVAIIGIHVDPDDAVAEINALANVVDTVVAQGKAKGGVWVMGDLNADCSYVTKTEWACIKDTACTDTIMKLYNPEKYEWLIPDDADTTTTIGSDCAYDRFVVAKPVPKQLSNASVHDFGSDVETLGALTMDEIKAISDHYPIELTWATAASATTAKEEDTTSSTIQVNRNNTDVGLTNGENGVNDVSRSVTLFCGVLLLCIVSLSL